LIDSDTGIGGSQTRFPDTRDSILGVAQGRSPDRESLIATYWKPAYKYIRVQWRKSNEDAKDLTQSFFTHALAKDFFQGFDPAKGRFRAYLRASLDNHVRNQHRTELSDKRSPGSPLLSVDFTDAEREVVLEPRDPSKSMEEYFQDEWVRHLFSLAVDTLKRNYESRGRHTHFALFSRYDLDEDSSELTYDRLAEEFDIPASQVTNWLAATRRDFRRIVLEQLRAVTADEREFQAEMLAVLGTE
jgi:RNA polymerase sigma factor (sigma-70 family)